MTFVCTDLPPKEYFPYRPISTKGEQIANSLSFYFVQLIDSIDDGKWISSFRLLIYPRAEVPKQTAWNAFRRFRFMTDLQGEITLFAAKRDLERANARQSAAFFIISGIDLPLALKSRGEERKRIIVRIERLLERERLKGTRRHWSYDLNRHIALKQALDRLRGAQTASRSRNPPLDRRSRRKRRPEAPQ